MFTFTEVETKVKLKPVAFPVVSTASGGAAEQRSLAPEECSEPLQPAACFGSRGMRFRPNVYDIRHGWPVLKACQLLCGSET